MKTYEELSQAEKDRLKHDDQWVNCWMVVLVGALVIGFTQHSKDPVGSSTLSWVVYIGIGLITITGWEEIIRRALRARRIYGEGKHRHN